MMTEILHSQEECQNEEEAVVALCESPASFFPILPSSQHIVAEEVVWIEGTITVSF